VLDLRGKGQVLKGRYPGAGALREVMWKSKNRNGTFPTTPAISQVGGTFIPTIKWSDFNVGRLRGYEAYGVGGGAKNLGNQY